MKFNPAQVRLVKNFSSLALIQATNFVLPLMVIPHQVKVLGIEKFGLVSFAQVIALYLVIFSEYGFNLSATKSVSENRNNPEKLRIIFNSVLWARLFLCLISFLIILLLTFILPLFREHYLLFIFSSSMFFGQAVVPVWFFLGMEKMKYITYLNVVSKILFTLLTFVVIRDEADYIYTNMLHGLGSFVAGIAALLLVKKSFNINTEWPDISHIKSTLYDGFAIFISNFATNIYMNINIVILQFVSSTEVVGLYSIAEKVLIAGKHLVSVIFQTVYPHACKLKIESSKSLRHFFTRFNYLAGGGFLFFGIIVYWFSDLIIYLLSNEMNPYSISLLRYMSFIPLIIGINIAAYQTMLIYNYKRAFSIIMISASILNVVLNVILGKELGGLGTVYTIAITEAFVLITMNIYLYIKDGLNYFVNLSPGPLQNT